MQHVLRFETNTGKIKPNIFKYTQGNRIKIVTEQWEK